MSGRLALLPAARIPHLVRKDGRFESDPLRAGLRYAFSRPAREELKQEMEAQFARNYLGSVTLR